MGFKTATAYVGKAAYEADRHGYVQPGRTERHHRRVGVRPAPDTMAVLTGYLPVEQGIACYAALQQHADTAVATGDRRTRDQIDHITRHSDSGATIFQNGRGACARGNLVREIPGWSIKLIDCGFHTGPHKIIITTPTGHHYLSRAPDPP